MKMPKSSWKMMTMLNKDDLIFPDWPAPSQVRSLQTTRKGGLSSGSYSSFNLGDHVGDNPLQVAANRQLRATFEQRCAALGLRPYFPSLGLSTDNAAMIAAAAYPRLKNHILADTSLNASASLPLG